MASLPDDPQLPIEDDPDALSVRLMRRVQAGDEAAFEELVRLHQGPVIGTITRMLGDPDEAHDIAQVVFLRVWKSAARWEPTAKFTTWLFTITRNLVFNESRRRSRKPAWSMDEPRSDDSDDRPREFADPSARPPDVDAHQAELERAVDAAVQKLPENQRLAVILRRHEDMDYEQIARILDTSVSSVKSLLFRARTTLRESLRGYLDQ